MANLVRTLGAVPVVFLLVGCPADDNKKEPPPDNNGDPACGNGIIEFLEACDPTVVPSAPCTDITDVPVFEGGTATCTSTCTVDVSGCVGDFCSNAGWYGDGDACDACNLAGGTVDQDCTSLCGADNTCSEYYDTWFGEWTCVSAGLPRDPDCTALCGNGVVDTIEDCDGTLLRSRTCEDLDYVAGGTLGCTADCLFDTSGCVPAVCGDGEVEGPEDCDGTNLDDMSCQLFGYIGGTLSCGDECMFDFAECIGAGGGTVCGDGTEAGYEACEGTETSNCQTEDFGSSTAAISCVACQWDLSPCDVCTQGGWYNDLWCDDCAGMGGAADSDDCALCADDGVCADYFDMKIGGYTCEVLTGNRDPDCGTCGDGVRFGAFPDSAGEFCDGSQFGGMSTACWDWGFLPGGLITCTADCTLDFSACSVP